MVSDKKIFKVFYLDIEGKQAPTTSRHVFWQIRIAWTFLVEGHQSIIEIGQEVFDKKHFKVFYTDIYWK